MDSTRSTLSFGYIRVTSLCVYTEFVYYPIYTRTYAARLRDSAHESSNYVFTELIHISVTPERDVFTLAIR